MRYSLATIARLSRMVSQGWVAILRDFAWRWWVEDRIRVSPTAGHWLRLQVGDTILIREMLFEILDRTTMISGNSSKLQLQLRSCYDLTTSHAVLCIVLDGPKLQFVSARLTVSGEMIELFEEDAVIVPHSPVCDNA
jgi:hypothetical protein